MVTWGQFAQDDPELAAFGLELIERYSIVYLATVAKDGSPRVHPVCPSIAQGHLFVGVIPTTPKRYDLARDGRYVLHALPGPNDSEFCIKGRAVQVTDPEMRVLAFPADGSGAITKDDDILFEMLIERAHSAVYEMGQENDQPVYKSTRRRWPKPSQ